MITFQDKVALNENADIPAVNKITADNVNDLKAGINTNETNISTLNTSVSNITGQILWTNERPTQAITTETTITLNSSDYDVLEIFYAHKISNNTATYSSRMLKNSAGTRLFIPSVDGIVYRVITKNSDTSFTIKQITNSVDGELAVPLYFVGYKTGLFN